MAGCDLAGFNCIRFDVPFLAEELFRVGHAWDTAVMRIVDVQRIYHRMEPAQPFRRAQAPYCARDHAGAHNALADVEGASGCAAGPTETLRHLPTDVDALGEMSGDRQRGSPDAGGKLAFDNSGHICLAFGKYKGWTLESIGRNDPGYLQWLMTKAELPASTIHVMRNSLEHTDV